MKALWVVTFVVAFAAMPARAQVTVSDAWVRGTVPGQKSTGAFMRLRSATDATLVGATAAVAKTVELHESSHEGGLMRMRAVEALALPAGKPVALEPGGYHLMLIDLAEPLAAGSTVTLTLVFRDRAGARATQAVAAEVRPLTAAGAHR
jgi:copper(I)-binding protein